MNHRKFNGTSPYSPHQVVQLKPVKAMIVGVTFQADKLGGVSPFYDLLMPGGEIEQKVNGELIDFVDADETRQHAERTVAFREGPQGTEILKSMPESQLSSAITDNLGTFTGRPVGPLRAVPSAAAVDNPVGSSAADLQPPSVQQDRRVATDVMAGYVGEERRLDRLAELADQKRDAEADAGAQQAG